MTQHDSHKSGDTELSRSLWVLFPTGAIVSAGIAVISSLALRSDDFRPTAISKQATAQEQVNVRIDRYETGTRGLLMADLIVTDRLDDVHVEPDGSTDALIISTASLRYGWPRAALASEYELSWARYQAMWDQDNLWLDWDKAAGVVTGWHTESIYAYGPHGPSGLLGSLPTSLPTRVLWTGMLVNTGVYAGVLLLVLIAYDRARKALRRRTPGACARCGYLVQDLAVCPECGTPNDAVKPEESPATG